jgi:hypothetical protein
MGFGSKWLVIGEMEESLRYFLNTKGTKEMHKTDFRLVGSRAFREPQCDTSATVTIKMLQKQDFGSQNRCLREPQATVLTMRASFLVAEALEATRKDALEATDNTEQ